MKNHHHRNERKEKTDLRRRRLLLLAGIAGVSGPALAHDPRGERMRLLSLHEADFHGPHTLAG